MNSNNSIIIRNLRQNNLKNVSLDIPKGKIVVFTGVSGSGTKTGEAMKHIEPLKAAPRTPRALTRGRWHKGNRALGSPNGRAKYVQKPRGFYRPQGFLDKQTGPPL